MACLQQVISVQQNISQRRILLCVFFYYYLKKQQSCIWYIPRIYWDKKNTKKINFEYWKFKVVKIEPSGRQQVGQPAGGKWYLLHLFCTLKKKVKKIGNSCMTPTFILLFHYCIFLVCLQIFRRGVLKFQSTLCYVSVYVYLYSYIYIPLCYLEYGATDDNKPFFIVLMEIVHYYYSILQVDKSKLQEEVSINSWLNSKHNLWVMSQLCGGWTQCIEMDLVSFCSLAALLVQ